jgi:hypothetical protein
MTDPQMLDRTFNAPIRSMDEIGVGWYGVVLDDSVEFFGTGKAVKITGTVDGHPIATAFMPTGFGGHFLPMSAKIRKAIGKDIGDEVTVHLAERR